METTTPPIMSFILRFSHQYFLRTFFADRENCRPESANWFALKFEWLNYSKQHDIRMFDEIKLAYCLWRKLIGYSYLSSRSDSLESLSITFSTFSRIIPTTSSTWKKILSYNTSITWLFNEYQTQSTSFRTFTIPVSLLLEFCRAHRIQKDCLLCHSLPYFLRISTKIFVF